MKDLAEGLEGGVIPKEIFVFYESVWRAIIQLGKKSSSFKKLK